MGKNYFLKKRSKWMSYVSILCFMVIGFLIGVIFFEQVDKFIYVNLGNGEYLLFIAVLIVETAIGMYLHIIIHEFGHLVFGLLTGYRFSSFRVGKWMWMKENEKLVLRKYSLAGTGGQCLMVPPDIKDGKLPYVLYNLGGSIMNILFGLIFIIPYMVFSDVAYLSMFFVVASIEGFVIGIMNGVPFSYGIVNNDGYNVMKMSEDDDALYSFWVMLKIGEQSTNGVRLKDMPAEWFMAGPFDRMKNTMVSSIGVFRANRLIDEHKFEDARNYINNLLCSRANLVGIYEILLNCDMLYCELVGKARKEEIENIYDDGMVSFMKSMKNFPSIIRTQYVYKLLYENNLEEAEMYKKKFEKVAESFPYKADIIAERELMEIAYGIKEFRAKNGEE